MSKTFILGKDALQEYESYESYALLKQKRLLEQRRERILNNQVDQSLLWEDELVPHDWLGIAARKHHTHIIPMPPLVGIPTNHQKE